MDLKCELTPQGELCILSLYSSPKQEENQNITDQHALSNNGSIPAYALLHVHVSRLSQLHTVPTVRWLATLNTCKNPQQKKHKEALVCAEYVRFLYATAPAAFNTQRNTTENAHKTSVPPPPFTPSPTPPPPPPPAPRFLLLAAFFLLPDGTSTCAPPFSPPPPICTSSSFPP